VEEQPGEPYAALIGRVIGGCRLVSLIGEGGMGTVFRGVQERLGAPVAVKLLRDHFRHSDNARQRFEREARQIARLRGKTPHVVQIYDFGWDAALRLYYIAMEHVDGESLAELLDRHGSLPPREALEAARQTALALEAARADGVIHRDIKPDNIMVARSGLVKVTDFGLAKELGAGTGVTGTHQVVGTPAYMSPEQAEGGTVDHRTDLYALGATLFACLTGRTPFDADTPLAMLMHHLRTAVPDPRDDGVEVSVGVAELLRALMAKQPDARIQTAGEAAGRLAELIAEQGAATEARIHQSLAELLPPPGADIAESAPPLASTVGPEGLDPIDLQSAVPGPTEATAQLAASTAEPVRLCGQCEEPVGAGARFCPGCGNPLFKPCTACGEEIPPTARFCETCGADVAAADALRDLVQRARDALAAREWDAAREAVDAVLARQPDHPEATELARTIDITLRRDRVARGAGIARARRALDEGQWTEAAAALETSLRLAPGDPEAQALQARLHEHWREVPLTPDGPGIMSFVRIEPGSFRMGDAEGDPDETPHPVTLTRPFWMQLTPVTQAQWTALRDGNPSSFRGPERPVDSVSWIDAQGFLEALAPHVAPLLPALPTEAEWEYACRAGTTTRWNFGDEESRLDLHAWHRGNSRGATQPAGRRPPNAWGLQDMHGGILEWCADWYGGYTRTPTDPTGPAEGTWRVLRGGAWSANAWATRSAKRFSRPPHAGNQMTGFRVVLRDPAAPGP
jgi:formylglycine-generating enzyme required for sulfatase activity/predicted Ser/Thr protein kinase